MTRASVLFQIRSYLGITLYALQQKTDVVLLRPLARISSLETVAEVNSS